MIKKIPLNDEHVRLGAKMAEFGGFLMPIQYPSGIIKEHVNTRENVTLFDISHMGEAIISGKDAQNLIQYLVTNDLNLLYDGKAQYAVMCYENGGTIDDMFYYRHSKEEFRFILNASNIEKDLNWIEEHAKNYEVAIQNLSNSRGRFALQGPYAEAVLDPLVKDDLSKLSRFHFIISEFTIYDFPLIDPAILYNENKDNDKGNNENHNPLAKIDLKDYKVKKRVPIFVSRTGYTAEDGFELSFAVEDSLDIWNNILVVGQRYNILPAGLGARDTLRTEACYSLYGHELSDEITPIEAGIGFCVKDKKEDFIGKEVLLKQKKEGVSRKIVGLELIERGIPRPHYKVFSINGDQIGYVTSGGFSPTLRKSIALALLNIEYTKLDTELLVQVRNKKVRAKVVKTPFYPYHGHYKKR
ncbi:MAG: glycine cleavage system aminomethyltransferase GcvT [Promethearchaeota archaeon]